MHLPFFEDTNRDFFQEVYSWPVDTSLTKLFWIKTSTVIILEGSPLKIQPFFGNVNLAEKMMAQLNISPVMQKLI